MYKNRSIIILSTKMDSLSMFETAAVGSSELYPSLAAMIYMASLFKEAAEEKIMEADTDILMTFLDNESPGNIGSFRFVYDIKNKKISNQNVAILEEHIKFVIIIGEMSLIKNPLYYITSNCTDIQVCNTFHKNLDAVSKANGINVRNFESQTDIEEFMFWKRLNVSIFKVESHLHTMNPFKHSFMDIEDPIKSEWLILISKSIVSCLLTTLKANVYEIINVKKLKFNSFEPNDIIHCLINVYCKPLMNILGSNQYLAYIKYGNPFRSHSFMFGTITAKQSSYINRLSYFVFYILLIYQSKSTTINPDCPDYEDKIYFSAVINETKYCFKTQIQVQKHITANREIFDNSFFQLTPLKTSIMILSANSEGEINTIALVLATIITALCLVVSIFCYRNIYKLFPKELFIE